MSVVRGGVGVEAERPFVAGIPGSAAASGGEHVAVSRRHPQQRLGGQPRSPRALSAATSIVTPADGRERGEALSSQDILRGKTLAVWSLMLRCCALLSRLRRSATWQWVPRTRAALIPLLVSGFALWSSAAAQAATLTVTPITWNIVGLDSNSPASGPYRFPVAARVCNTSGGATTATVTYVWDDGMGVFWGDAGAEHPAGIFKPLAHCDW